MQPTTAVANAIRRTAPAEISLAAPIKASCSLQTLSASFSIAVLNPSAMKTDPMHKDITHHSIALILNKKPATITPMAAQR